MTFGDFFAIGVVSLFVGVLAILLPVIIFLFMVKIVDLIGGGNWLKVLKR